MRSPPGTEKDTYRSILRYAVSIAGSEPALAERLNVTGTTLKFWLESAAPIPDDVFLGAVDVIVEASPSDIARSRTLSRTYSELP